MFYDWYNSRCVSYAVCGPSLYFEKQAGSEQNIIQKQIVKFDLLFFIENIICVCWIQNCSFGRTIIFIFSVESRVNFIWNINPENTNLWEIWKTWQFEEFPLVLPWIWSQTQWYSIHFLELQSGPQIKKHSEEKIKNVLDRLGAPQATKKRNLKL